MEQWEHMVVRVVSGGGGPEMVLTPYRPNLRNDLRPAGIENVIAVLDELGEEGWQLVTVDRDSATYWLKRRKELPEGMTVREWGSA